jgi:hypothetical protein
MPRLTNSILRRIYCWSYHVQAGCHLQSRNVCSGTSGINMHTTTKRRVCPAPKFGVSIPALMVPTTGRSTRLHAVSNSLDTPSLYRSFRFVAMPTLTNLASVASGNRDSIIWHDSTPNLIFGVSFQMLYCTGTTRSPALALPGTESTLTNLV